MTIRIQIAKKQSEWNCVVVRRWVCVCLCLIAYVIEVNNHANVDDGVMYHFFLCAPVFPVLLLQSLCNNQFFHGNMAFLPPAAC